MIAINGSAGSVLRAVLLLAVLLTASAFGIREQRRIAKRTSGPGYHVGPMMPRDGHFMYNAGPYRGPPAYNMPPGIPGNFGRRAIECPDFEPFRCPGGKGCISIQYLCDGAPDCPDGHDEKVTLCTAAKRPPVEETASFLNSLLASHGANYLEKLFGSKARGELKKLGGVRKVAIALSESQTIDGFGRRLQLEKNDVDHLRSVFMAVENGDIGMLKSLGIKDSELGDVKFFLEKLVNTGFLD